MSGSLQRHPDWRNRLIAYLTTCARRPFEPGKHDCALFLAGGVLAMTGVDFAAPYRGRYTTVAEGVRLLRRHDFADHAALARTSLVSRPVSMAREGDGAIVREGASPALGIVQGAGIYVLRETGLGLMPLTAAEDVLEV
ncbi:DUF6950 family protein [Roseobacter sp. S98]|uniref:DUF6950 family protein n=1 Tax=Roseobacter algicola (ex Choi et al. 2025) (nom. illeg.) TaxID=3092138 RepID=UPI0035C6BA64